MDDDTTQQVGPVVCISSDQATLHKATEAIAMGVIVPYLVWLATRNRPLAPLEKGALWILVAGTILVDGGLLRQWSGKK